MRSVTSNGDTDADSGATRKPGVVPPRSHYFGTFVLKRRPVEYLLSCPSEAEFAASRPRALWKLALDATLRIVRGRLSSESLAARRKARETFIDLLAMRDKKGLRVVAQEWAELTKGLHPDDLHLWYCIARFRAHRQITHR